MFHSFENFSEAAEGLKKLLPEVFTPEIGIICGSGLSGLQQAVTGPRIEVPYNEIKGFPVSTGECNTDLNW
jgi:purine nucleoside phosphorylase